MTRHTKIVATLGPASSDPVVLERMIRAGVDVVRLNFSHGKAQDHIDRAALVREVAARVGKPVAIMADLQGPKIRVGKFAEGKVMLENGQPFVLDGGRSELGDVNGVGLDYKELPRDVKPGDTLLLNDGLIVMTVDAVRGEAVHTTVKVGGELSNNKGINKQGGGLTAPALTAKDMEDIRTAMSFQCEYVAVSFPKSATDMEMARQLANVAGEPWRHKPGMIAKIERTEAIPQLEAILKASDGIMVARGDLAVEVGNAAVPALQKKMIRMAREMDKVTITATQMMESMIQPGAHPRRGQRRGQRGARRHRRRDAQRRDGRRQVPGGDHRADGQHCARGRARRGNPSWTPTSASSSLGAHRPEPSPWVRCSPRTTWAARPSWR
jgi:pyruvate kinase